MPEKLKFYIEGDSKSGEKALDRIDAKVQNVTASFAKWGVTAAAAIGALSVKEATEFETKIAEVSTLLDDTSGLEGMEQAVKDLAIQYGQFPDEQVSSLYSIISAGAETSAEAIQTLEAANKLAIGGVTDVATAADGLTSILNAYGEEAGTTTEVTDAMFVAMKAGKTTIGELLNSIGNVAPIASEAGVELDELLAATAALTKGGVTTNVAMTGLRQVIASILKPTAEAQKEAAKLGLEFNSTALESKGLQGFLQELTEKTGGNKDSLTQLFGSVEALGPVFALTGSQADSFSTIMEGMNSKAGETDKAFKKIDETGEQAMKRLAAAGDIAAITLGNQLLPAIADVANFLVGPTVDGVNRIEDAFFFLKASAFAVMGGIAESILNILEPIFKVSAAVDNFFGRSSDTSALDDLRLFADSMEAGAIETFKARDAAEEHNIQLREQSNLLRGLDEDGAIQLENKKVRNEEEQNTNEEHQAKLTEQQAQAEAKRLAMEKRTRDQRVAGAKQMFSDLSTALMSGSKEQFEIGKKAAIVEAGISTYEGAQKAFTSLAGIPYIGPALGAAAAAAAIAAGLVRIGSINQQQFQAHDGIDSFPRSGSFVGNMEKGEMILNKGNSEGIRKLAEQAESGPVGRGVTVSIGQITIQAKVITDLQQFIRDDFAPELVEAVRRGVDLGLVAKESY